MVQPIRLRVATAVTAVWTDGTNSGRKFNAGTLAVNVAAQARFVHTVRAAIAKTACFRCFKSHCVVRLRDCLARDQPVVASKAVSGLTSVMSVQSPEELQTNLDEYKGQLEQVTCRPRQARFTATLNPFRFPTQCAVCAGGRAADIRSWQRRVPRPARQPS